MKSKLILSFLFISCLLNAQVWVKPNATWHYDFYTLGYGGFMKIQHIADTVIESKNAMVFETTVTAFTTNMNYDIIFYFSDTLQRNYTYVNGDTVFYWRNNKFEVLYNFSEVSGGGWMLGTESAENNMCDDTSTVDVLSAEMVNILGTNYKSLSLQSTNSSPYRLEGKFNERFGAYAGNSPWSYLFPNFAFCDPGIAVEYYTFWFKCFQDDELFYNPSGEDCEYYLTYLSLSDSERKPLSIFPNPTKDILNIQSNLNGQIQVLDITGKVVIKSMKKTDKDFSFDVSTLNAGHYVVKLITESGQSIINQLIKK